MKISIGLLDILGIAFIVLKIAKVISWSWFIVLLPIYAPIILRVVLFIIKKIILTTMSEEERTAYELKEGINKIFNGLDKKCKEV